jgi:toxin ParE1/3/4
VDHRVVWSPGALDDADAIAGYIERDSPHYASSVIRRLRDTARTLRNFPLRGRMVPELGDVRIREKVLYGWRLIYRVENRIVTILAIVHSRQSFATGVGRVAEVE